MYTIKDLAEGRVAVINDGTLEELQKVIKEAFPNDISIPTGVSRYYFQSLQDTTKWASTDSFCIKPTQSVKDFLKPIEEPWVPKRGDKILVKGFDGRWVERIFITLIENCEEPYVVVSYGDERNFYEGLAVKAVLYKEAKPIRPQTELTMEEIAEKFGIDVNNLKIVK